MRVRHRRRGIAAVPRPCDASADAKAAPCAHVRPAGPWGQAEGSSRIGIPHRKVRSTMWNESLVRRSKISRYEKLLSSL